MSYAVLQRTEPSESPRQGEVLADADVLYGLHLVDSAPTQCSAEDQTALKPSTL